MTSEIGQLTNSLLFLLFAIKLYQYSKGSLDYLKAKEVVRRVAAGNGKPAPEHLLTNASNKVVE